MTWIYEPYAYATGMADSSSGFDPSECQYEPWLVLSGTATQRPCSWRGWKNRPWISALFGTISQPSMAARGVAEWIASLPVSPANPSRAQGNNVELTMTVGFGLPSDGSSVTWDRDTFSWRTSPDLFGAGYLTSSPTLPTSGSMRNGVCSQRPTLAPPTSGNGSGSWPTPTTKDTTLVTSPLNVDGKHGMELRRAAGHWHILHRQMTTTGGDSGPLKADLNPRFVAALMGVPWGWMTPSTLEATDWSRWQQAQPSWPSRSDLHGKVAPSLPEQVPDE